MPGVPEAGDDSVGKERPLRDLPDAGADLWGSMFAKVLPVTPLDVSILLMSQAGRAALAEIEALESELAQVGWQLDAARRVIDGWPIPLVVDTESREP